MICKASGMDVLGNGRELLHMLAEAPLACEGALCHSQDIHPTGFLRMVRRVL